MRAQKTTSKTSCTSSHPRDYSPCQPQGYIPGCLYSWCGATKTCGGLSVSSFGLSEFETCMSTCLLWFFRYYHRSLNPKKLIEVKFSHLARNMTMQRTLKLNKLPDHPRVEGFRKMLPTDIQKAHVLLDKVSKLDKISLCSQSGNMYTFFFYICYKYS